MNIVHNNEHRTGHDKKAGREPAYSNKDTFTNQIFNSNYDKQQNILIVALNLHDG